MISTLKINVQIICFLFISPSKLHTLPFLLQTELILLNDAASYMFLEQIDVRLHARQGHRASRWIDLLLIGFEGSKLIDDHGEGGDFGQFEIVNVVWIERHTDVSGLGVDAEWRFEQMVDAGTDVGVESWVQVAQHELLQGQVSLACSVLGTHVLGLPVCVGLSVCQPHGSAVSLLWIPFRLDQVTDIAVQVLEKQVLMLLGTQQILLVDHDLLEKRCQEIVGFAEIGVQRPWQVQFAGELVSHTDVAVLGHSLPHFVGHVSSLRVAHPAMYTSTSGEYPQQIGQIEIVFQHIRQQFGRHVQIWPALLTDLCALTARPDIIVGVHIDIKDHFLLNRHKGLLIRHEMPGRCEVENRTDIDFMGCSWNEVVFEFFGRFVAEVTAVDVVG